MEVSDTESVEHVSPPAKRSKNFSRSEIRSKSVVDCDIEYGVRQSLQECNLSENLEKLQGLIEKFADGSTKQRNLRALVYILQCLFANAPSMLSFMTFKEAFDIYKSYIKECEKTTSKDQQKKNEFRNLLCSRQYGLCIYLLRMPNYELVILRPDEMCLKKFLSYIVGQEQTAPGGVSKEYCQDLISVMDTEWDRRVFRVFAAMGRTNEEFSALGFKSDLRKADKEKVEGLVGDMKDIEIEAEKMVMDGLESKKKRVEEKVKEHTRIVNEKQHKWTEIQLSERKEAIEDLQEEIAKTELFIARDEKTKKALERMFLYRLSI